MTYRAGVIGASGYSGSELLRLLAAHPEIEVAVATSREFAGRDVAEVYPNLASYAGTRYAALEDAALDGLDLVFLALPHGASMDVGARLAAAGTRVVDFSADFRLRDPAAYPAWFKGEHTAPEWLAKAVYGLPELHRDEIRGATLVANPGCYPTATILALAPLVARGLIDPATIVVSAASGVSGAGRGMSAGVHFSHVDENVKAYGLPAHKHTPEMEQELGALAGADVRLTFVPHLVPMVRGILATCTATLTADASADALRAAAAEFYAGEPFVRVLPAGLPETKYTLGSNLCLLAYEADARTGRVVAVSAIDNLGKGAAGQALQNANLVLGLPETAGLPVAGVYP